jgi:hypothetical protein
MYVMKTESIRYAVIIFRLPSFGFSFQELLYLQPINKPKPVDNLLRKLGHRFGFLPLLAGKPLLL